MYWKALFGYWIGVYGHAVHELFAQSSAVYQDPKEEFTWRGHDGQLHTVPVYPKWVANIKAQQVAGVLEYEGRNLWIKCPLGGQCQEVTEAKAKQGGWGVALTPYKNVAYNETRNTDLNDSDTICVRSLGVLMVSDHGRKGGARWLDLYIGEHGYYDWGGSPGPQDTIWVLRPDPSHILPCWRDLCPI
jgi:hypothetical protein